MEYFNAAAIVFEECLKKFCAFNVEFLSIKFNTIQHANRFVLQEISLLLLFSTSGLYFINSLKFPRFITVSLLELKLNFFLQKICRSSQLCRRAEYYS